MASEDDKKWLKFARFMGVDTTDKGWNDIKKDYFTLYRLIKECWREPSEFGVNMTREEWIQHEQQGYRACGTTWEAKYDEQCKKEAEEAKRGAEDAKRLAENTKAEEAEQLAEDKKLSTTDQTQADIAKLQAEIAKLRAENTSIEELQARNAQLHEENKKLQAENDKLLAENAKLKTASTGKQDDSCDSIEAGKGQLDKKSVTKQVDCQKDHQEEKQDETPSQKHETVAVTRTRSGRTVKPRTRLIESDVGEAAEESKDEQQQELQESYWKKVRKRGKKYENSSDE